MASPTLSVTARRHPRCAGPAQRRRPPDPAGVQPGAVRPRSAPRSSSSARTSSAPGRSRSAAPTPGWPGCPTRRRRAASSRRAPATTPRASPSPAQLLGIDVKVYMPHGAPMPKISATKAYGADDRVGRHDRRRVPRRGPRVGGRQRRGPHPPVRPPRHRGRAGHLPGSRSSSSAPRCGPSSSAPAAAGCSPGSRPPCGRSPRRADRRRAGRGGRGIPAVVGGGQARRLRATCQTMADGIAVGLPGDVPFALVESSSTAVETVSEEELSRALLFLLERAKLVVEPAGAAAVAHLLDRAGRSSSRGPSSRCCPAATSTRCCCCGSSATAWRRPGATSVPGARAGRPGVSWPGCSPTGRVDANVLEVSTSATASLSRSTRSRSAAARDPWQAAL